NVATGYPLRAHWAADLPRGVTGARAEAPGRDILWPVATSRLRRHRGSNAGRPAASERCGSTKAWSHRPLPRTRTLGSPVNDGRVPGTANQREQNPVTGRITAYGSAKPMSSVDRMWRIVPDEQVREWKVSDGERIPAAALAFAGAAGMSCADQDRARRGEL